MSRKIKVIFVSLLIIAIIWLSAMPFGAIEVNRYYGDIDNDAYVTTKDARIALKIAAGINDKDLFGLDFKAADLNEDGKIQTDDARLILRTAAGHMEKKLLLGFEFQVEPDKFAEKLNDYRFRENHRLIKLTVMPELCEVADIAAQEYATKTGSALIREDGTYFNKLLDSKGIKYTLVDKIIVEASYGQTGAVEKLIADRQSQRSILSSNFDKIGVGAFSNDGRNFYWCIFLVK